MSAPRLSTLAEMNHASTAKLCHDFRMTERAIADHYEHTPPEGRLNDEFRQLARDLYKLRDAIALQIAKRKAYPRTPHTERP